MRLSPLLRTGMVAATILCYGTFGLAATSEPVDARGASHSFHMSFHAASSGGYSRSTSSFSSSRSSSSSGGYTRSAPSSSGSYQRSAPSTSSSGSYQRAAPTTSASSNPYARSGQSAGGSTLSRNASSVDRSIARGHSAASLQAFRADQAKFKTPPVGAPTTKAAATASPVWRSYGTRWHNYDDYRRSRTVAIEHLSPTYRVYYSSPPIYVLHARPAYGSYSGVFLGAILGAAAGAAIDHSYAMWYYSHMNDPYVQQWRADMMQQAAENAELQQQIAALDTEVQQLKAQNVQPTDALPDGVDPSLVVADQTVMAATADDGWSMSSIIGTIFGVVVVLVMISYFFMRRQNKLAYN